MKTLTSTSPTHIIQVITAEQLPI